MSAVANSSRQLPLPFPIPTGSPFAALPRSKSPDVMFTSPKPPRVRVTGPKRRPVSSNAVIRTVPDVAERLTMRTRLSCLGKSAARTNGRVWIFCAGAAGAKAARVAARLNTATAFIVHSPRGWPLPERAPCPNRNSPTDSADEAIILHYENRPSGENLHFDPHLTRK